MPRTLVVLATAKIDDGEYCDWGCPLFSREGGAHCAMVQKDDFDRTGVRVTALVLDGTKEMYRRSFLCKAHH